jgi:hypothetical protein
MVTTVTTTTTAVVMSTANASLSLIAILALIVFLIQQEIFSNLDDPRVKELGQLLNIAIFPLLVIFFVAVGAGGS